MFFLVLIFSTAHKVLKIKNKHFQKNTKMIYRNTNAHVELLHFVLIGFNWPHAELSPRAYLLPADLGGQLKKTYIFIFFCTFFF